jgi:uncharacterized protein
MPRITVALATMLSFMAFSPVAAQGFLQKGIDAIEAGDFNTALRFLRPLGEQGDAEALYHLGRMYHPQLGLLKKLSEHVKWYRKSAEQGYARAQVEVGMMHEWGNGVPQDYVEAVKWYRLAAEQGDAQAQYNLGQMYEAGLGVPQVYILAHILYNLAFANGYVKAGKLRDIIAKKMTTTDTSKAQAMALECMMSSYKKCGY